MLALDLRRFIRQKDPNLMRQRVGLGMSYIKQIRGGERAKTPINEGLIRTVSNVAA